LRALRQFNALAGATVQPANIVEVETEPEQEEEEEEEEELQQ
jgi:hypothetical protein